MILIRASISLKKAKPISPYSRQLLKPVEFSTFLQMKRFSYLVGFTFLVSVSYSCRKEKNTAFVLPWTANPPQILTFGGALNESAQAVVATPNGGFAVLGHTQSEDGDLEEKTNASFDLWLLQFDAQGDLLWDRTYGGVGNERAADLVLRPEGGFVLLGSQENLEIGSPNPDLWVLGVDANGTLQWEQSFGYSGADYGTQLLATKEGSYLLSGVLDVTASNGLGNKKRTRKHAGGDYWVLKLDRSGQLLWRNYFGGLQTDTPYGLAETMDGGYLIVGSSDSADTDITNNIGSYDAWVVKINEDGQKLWERNYGGSQIDNAYGIRPAENGSFVLIGDSRSTDLPRAPNKGGADLWFWEIASDGTLLNEKTFGGSSFEVGHSIERITNKQWLIAGSSRSSEGDLMVNQGQNDLWTLVLDNKGEQVLWQQTLGGSQIDFAYDATQLSNGTVVTVGESSSADGDLIQNEGYSDLVIILNK